MVPLPEDRIIMDDELEGNMKKKKLKIAYSKVLPWKPLTGNEESHESIAR
jgi:hypothetical protein